MYNQPRRPGMQPPTMSACEMQAKDKLATFVYEYLLLSGHQKSADCFKDEVFNQLHSATTAGFKPSDNGPGFLQNWFMLFWDLYCAAPERSGEAPEASGQGKMFYDMFIQPTHFGPGPMTGMPPGMFPGGAGPMGMPGPDGMMPGPGFAGRFPGRPGPGMPQPGYAMFPGGPGGQRMPSAPGIRMQNPSFAPGPGMSFRPSYLDSPGAGAPFPPSAMMPNGMGSQAPMSSMSSPGMAPNGADGSFMLSGMPSSSTAMTFGMGDTSVAMGNGSCMPPASMGDGCQVMMMNGEDLKQSPVSTPRGVNGGTPAPGSAQSGQPSSGTPIAANADEKPGSNSKSEDIDEISKIKQGLMDDFTPKEEVADQTGGGGFYQ